MPVPLGPRATTLAEFRQGLAGADASAIHHHMVEARARSGRRGGDFAAWLRGALGLTGLAEQIEHIDLYLTTPERVRGRLLTLIDRALEAEEAGGIRAVSAIDLYRAVAPPKAVDIIQNLAARVRGRRFLHLTGGRLGGGPAEILRAAVPLLNDLGVETGWEVTGGDAAVLRHRPGAAGSPAGSRARAHRGAAPALPGMNQVTAKKLNLDADVVFAHDVQPASLVAHRSAGRWLWRCHFDCSRPQTTAWSFFRIRRPVRRGHLLAARFAGRLAAPRYVIPPSIDPLSEKNRELGSHELAAILVELRVERDKPLLVQVGPLTRDGDPLGAINVYRLVKRHHAVRIVLAGTGGDDHDGRGARRRAGGRPGRSRHRGARATSGSAATDQRAAARGDHRAPDVGARGLRPRRRGGDVEGQARHRRSGGRAGRSSSSAT